MTVQGATFSMRGQQYRGHASSPAVSALGSESDDPGSTPPTSTPLKRAGKTKCELRF